MHSALVAFELSVSCLFPISPLDRMHGEHYVGEKSLFFTEEYKKRLLVRPVRMLVAIGGAMPDLQA